MSWSREVVSLLIAEYRKWPNLYKTKSPNYKNRNLRKVALDQITTAIHTVKANVHVQDIINKFNALKQNAARELKRKKESQKSGTGTDDVYVPTLWYLDDIMYCFDSNEVRLSVDTLDNEETGCTQSELSQGNYEEYISDNAHSDGGDSPAIEEYYVDEDGTLNTVTDTRNVHSPADAITPSAKTRKRRRTVNTSAEDGVLKQMSTALQAVSNRMQIPNEPVASTTRPLEELKSFGDCITAKLARIKNYEIQLEAEMQIHKIVNDALLKYLKESNK